MSRRKAKRLYRGKELQAEMEKRGIYVRSTSWSGLAEEAGGAYKDIDEVIRAAAQAEISKPVCRFAPIGNIKG
jgi:tRNA-splicing ligase RtcB